MLRPYPYTCSEDGERYLYDTPTENLVDRCLHEWEPYEICQLYIFPCLRSYPSLLSVFWCSNRAFVHIHSVFNRPFSQIWQQQQERKMEHQETGENSTYLENYYLHLCGQESTVIEPKKRRLALRTLPLFDFSSLSHGLVRTAGFRSIDLELQSSAAAILPGIFQNALDRRIRWPNYALSRRRQTRHPR